MRTHPNKLWSQYHEAVNQQGIPSPIIDALFASTPNDIKLIALRKINDESLSIRELNRLRHYRERKARTILADASIRTLAIVGDHMAETRHVVRLSTPDCLSQGYRMLPPGGIEVLASQAFQLDINPPIVPAIRDGLPRRGHQSPIRPAPRRSPARSWTVPRDPRDIEHKIYWPA